MTNSDSLRLEHNTDAVEAHRFFYLTIIMVVAGLTASAIITTKPHLCANDRSRWCTIWSLVERGTYQIDEIVQDRKWQTIDRVRHNGHFYSTKPPLMPTMVAGLYWTVKKTTGWTMRTKRGIDARVTRLILMMINWIPNLVALVLMAMLVERYVKTDIGRLFIMMSAAFGTMLTPFLVTLNNHTVAAFSVLFAVYPAIRIVCDGERRARYFLIAGFFAAFACCNELPAALFSVILFLLLLKQSPALTMKCFVPSALIPLAGFFYTNYLVTGGWKPFYMYYGTEKYLYDNSYWLNPQGFDKGGDTPLVYLMNCTIGHRGIFSLSPIFLLTLAGWLTLRKHRDSPLKPFLWISLFLTVAILGFYLTRTANYNYGGNCSGLRWTFWLIPLWLISMIPVWNRWGTRRWVQITAAVLLSVSVFSAAWPVGNPWQPPWIYVQLERVGWINTGK